MVEYIKEMIDNGNLTLEDAKNEYDLMSFELNELEAWYYER